MRRPPPVGAIPARAGEPTRAGHRDAGVMDGSIPARAGEPRDGQPACSAVRGHGLSPRVRGNRAGRTGAGTKLSRSVYPRACGGTGARHLRVEFGEAEGLSPRVRGNLLRRITAHHAQRTGLSPRRAGEPESRGLVVTDPSDRVYPRACGGTSVWLQLGHTPAASWVYPRACGGNRVWIIAQRMAEPHGSIPARAGEPAPSAFAGDHETFGSIPARAGEPCAVARHLRGDPSGGSIPARAGEPLRRITNHAQQRVYPRACGGTGISRLVVLPTMGLSPRVRGNRVRAHSTPKWIYTGLSPRVRGNPGRTILVLSPKWKWVYPRACGGNPTGNAAISRLAPVNGLSPRVRGNLSYG